MEELGSEHGLKARGDLRQSFWINSFRPKLVLLQESVRNPRGSRGRSGLTLSGALFPQLSRDHRWVAPRKEVSSRLLFGRHSMAGVCVRVCVCVRECVCVCVCVSECSVTSVMPISL